MAQPTELLTKNYKIKQHAFQTIMKMTLVSILSALGIALKFAFAFLPNVEFVTFILMMAILFCHCEVGFGVINIYCLLNMVCFGIATWSIMYFIIFNLYGLIMLLCKPLIFKWWWISIIIIALMGYTFGTLYAIQEAIINGVNVGIAYWIRGLIFDAIHGTANGVICLVLYGPIFKLMEVLKNQWSFLFNKQFNKIPVTARITSHDNPESIKPKQLDSQETLSKNIPTE